MLGTWRPQEAKDREQRFLTVENRVSIVSVVFVSSCQIERVACRIRSGLFRRLLQQPLPAFQNQQLGILIKHLSRGSSVLLKGLTRIDVKNLCLR